MSRGSRDAGPHWLDWLQLACAALAGGTWYSFLQAGPWPLTVALVPLALRWVLTGRLGRRTPFDVPLLLFLLTAALGVWAAYDRTTAWAKFWLIVGAVLLFYALAQAGARRLADDGQRAAGDRRWTVDDGRTWPLALFGAGVSVYFLATHDWNAYPAKIDMLTRLGRALQAPLPPLPGHRLHPNVAGGILAMMLPFSGLVAFSAGAPWQGASRRQARLARAVGGGLLLVTLFGLVMTTSRGAWLGLGVAAYLLAVWVAAGWLAGQPADAHAAKDVAARRAGFAAALMVFSLAGLVVAASAWPGGLTAAVEALPGPETGSSRFELLGNALTLVRDYPLIGAGLGGFQMLYSTYVILLHVGYIVHSHNLLLNVAIEQGLPALGLLLWMWLAFAVIVWRSVGRKQTSASRQRETEAMMAAALALAVVLVHGQVDDALYGSRAVLLLFVPLAFAVQGGQEAGGTRREAGSGEQGAERTKRAALLLPAVLVVVLVAALVWRRPVLALVHANLGAVQQSQIELRGYAWPEWPIQDAVRRAVDLSRPIAQFERALALDPRNATANRRLGMIELSLGQYEQALRHLEAAYEAEPGCCPTRQLLGEAYLANGRLEEGRALWSTVPAEQGQLQARVWWYSHLKDEQRAAWMREAAEGR